MISTTLLSLCEASEFIFWGSALFGTTLFLIRLILSLTGGFVEELCDSDRGVDGTHDLHHSSTGAFKLFTVHSLSGFFMMFGWVGLACLNQLRYSPHGAFIAGLVAGIAIMIIVTLIFKVALVLVNPGAQFDIEKTVGLVGTVYQQITSQTLGKIHVVVDGITRELLAQSFNHTFIPSFTLVTIIKVLDHETVVVQAITS